MVMWKEVPAIDLNGILIIYEVLFKPTPADGQDVGASVLENTTDLNLTVDRLAENVLYSVSVRAYTAVGEGPFSAPPDLIMTDQDSKSASLGRVGERR